jgi:nucleotide-binding universal stress UspA family protein
MFEEPPTAARLAESTPRSGLVIQIQRILYPTDFSESSERAFDYVRQLARTFGAKVTLLHVIDEHEALLAYGIVIARRTMRDQARAYVERRFAALKKTLAEDGVQADGVILSGAPFVKILECARDSQADLIVMSTHGWSAVKQAIIGGAAERVVRKASCPVLTVRQLQGDASEPLHSEAAAAAKV